MITAGVLVGVAIVLASYGGRVLSAARWTPHAPWLAVLMWQSLSGAILASIVLAGLAIALPALPAFFADIAGWIGACLGILEDHYSSPLGSSGAIVVFALILVVLAWMAFCTGGEAWTARRARIATRRALGLVPSRVLPGEAIVIDDARLAAYCVPGRHPTVVMTTGALDRLSDVERQAVVAHERAHLRCRHHWALTWAVGLHKAFPFVPAFRDAAEHVSLLIEMHADDSAARVSGRRALASALVHMAEGGAPASALAINGSGVLARVQRLGSTRRRISRAGVASLVGMAIVMSVAPVLILMAPAAESALRDHCTSYVHPCDIRGSRSPLPRG